MSESSPDTTRVDGMGTPVVSAPPGGTTLPGLTLAAPTGQGEPAQSVEPSTPQTPGGTPAREPAQAPEQQTFYDPRDLPQELQPHWKQMQASFTKRMQALSTERQKVEAYNAFMADPVGNIMRLAPQYGLTLTPAQAAAIAGQAQQQAQQQEPWTPQTWEDVDKRIMSIEERALARAKQEVMQEMNPVLQTVRGMVQQSAEQHLSQIDPTWRENEPEMIELLKKHPSMANDLEALYYLAARNKVEARAIQNYEQRQRQKVDGARVSPGSTARGTPAPRQIKSFDDAVAAAREELSKGSRR